jgi:hypothetical protein
MKLHEEFKLYENMWDKNVAKPAVPAASNTIRCMFALYEDDDGYVSKVGVYAGDLSTVEMEDLLTEQGMSFVTCWDEYEYTTSNTYNLGDVVEVFDVEDGDIEDVAAIAGKEPEEYKNVGFFESAKTKKLKEAAGSNIKTFGRKSYDLSNEDELEAWVKANAELQMKRYPGRYDGNIDAWWDSFSKFDLKRTILDNLITRLVSEGTDKAIIDKLVAMRDENQKAFDKDKRAINSVKYEADVKDIIAAVKAGIDTFNKTLTPNANEYFGKRTIATLEAAEQHIIDFVLDLAFGMDNIGAA